MSPLWAVHLGGYKCPFTYNLQPTYTYNLINNELYKRTSIILGYFILKQTNYLSKQFEQESCT